MVSRSVVDWEELFQMGKEVHNSIDILLEHACPSIRSRIRLEILAESPQSDDVLMLQSLILEDDLVKKNYQPPAG